MGKTRLAADAIREFISEADRNVHAHNVWLARLGAGVDPAEVEQETAREVIGSDFSATAAKDALVEHLVRRARQEQGTSRTVILMDNCEHVLAAVRALVGTLLDTEPTITIVATSRTPIGWLDEHLLEVSPLLPRHALSLFRQRAELVGYPVVGPTQSKLAAEICSHIDCSPLFIQLAAARLRRQPLISLLNGLTGRPTDDARMGWSHGSQIGADERHSGVVDVLTWSFDLCTPKEQLLLERMSVFAAGHDTGQAGGVDKSAEVGAELHAIRAVCSDPDVIAEKPTDDHALRLRSEEIESLLEGLADHSLISIHLSATTARYYLLESVRVFASRQLGMRRGASAQELSRRHLHYYRDEVTHAARRWFGSAEQEVLTWARAAWDNILTAIEMSTAQYGDAEAGLELCLGLVALRVPFVRGTMRDIRRWTEGCLEASRRTGRASELHVTATAVMAWLAVRQGETADAERLMDECIAAQSLSSATYEAWRDHPEDDHGFSPHFELAWGTALFMAKQDPNAIHVLTRARDKFAGSGESGSTMFAGMFAGMAAALLGTKEQAFEIAGRCLDEATQAGAPWAKSWAQLSWAITEIKHGNPAEAAGVLRSALEQQMAVGDQWGMTWSVELRTWALAYLIRQGRPDAREVYRPRAIEIAHLAGGVKTLRRSLGINIAAMGTFAVESTKATAIARRILGPADFLAAEARGGQLSPEFCQVQRLALGAPIDDLAPSFPWNALTPAEEIVAVLAAAGLPTSSIASLRERSGRTIETQLARVFKKLKIADRHEIVAHIPDGRIEELNKERQIPAHVIQKLAAMFESRTSLSPWAG
jgi:predicted ATPase/DNA-binding CsgD family transcriptional regulator